VRGALREAAIKRALGRLQYPDSIEAGVEATGFEKLSISLSHAEHAVLLFAYHGDPFGRMLIAQAQVERLTLITDDRRIVAYDVATLWS